MNLDRQIVLESSQSVRAVELAGEEGFWKRVELLPRDQRLLLELAIRGGCSRRQIARLLGRPPGSITRALQRLSRRLHDPIALALLHPACTLEPIERQLGVEHFLCGLCAKELAGKHHLSRTYVLRVLHSLRVWHRGASARASSRSRPLQNTWTFETTDDSSDTISHLAGAQS